jgi:hypothetical protein
MTLGDLTLPIPIETARGYALVFMPQLAGRLAELHSQYGSTNCIPVPRVMTDGRLMLSADVLTEVGPGGLLHAMWEAADRDALNAAVDVLPWADAVALLPPDPPMPVSSPTLSPVAAPSGGGTLAPGVAPSLGGALRR